MREGINQEFEKSGESAGGVLLQPTVQDCTRKVPGRSIMIDAVQRNNGRESKEEATDDLI